MRRALCLFALIVHFITAYSQTSHLFTSDRELSSTMINEIYQDRNNMIWIATEDGLNRYDGSKFTLYKNNPDDPHSICDNYVKTIFEDSKGRLFIGTYGGVQMYDPATDKFSKRAIRSDNQLFNTNVIDFAEISNGEIWITGNILCKLEVKGDDLFVTHIDLPIEAFYTDVIIEDRDKNIWISNGENGIYRLNQKKEIKRYLNNEVNLSITDIKIDQLGNIYVGTIGKGLLKYSKQADKFVQVTNNSNDELPIKTIYIDKQNNIYLGTDGKGVKTLSETNESIEDKHIPNHFFDSNSAKVHSVLIDNSGNTWLGIFQKGAVMIPSKPNKFNYIGQKSISKNFIGGSCITSFYRDKNNYLWIGTDNDGMYGMTPNETFYKHFSPNGVNGFPPSIMCLYEDSNENLWVGSYTKGLGIVDRKSGRYNNFEQLKDNNGKSVQRVYALLEDNKRRLWIASMGAGLFYYDINKKVVHFPENINKDNIWNTCMVYSQKDEILYIGNYDGINVVDISKENEFKNEIILRQHIIYSLFQDEEGILWAGSSEGLIKIEPKTKQINYYTSKDGLAGNTVYAIQSDSKGTLWLSTNDGITQFNTKTIHCTNYYMGDGLQGNEFYKNASMKDKNGTLWFGGINGITYFNPKEISSPGSEMNIRITDFYLKDEPVRKGTLSNGKEIIDCPVFNAKDFYLSYNDNSFSIEFSCIEMTNHEGITYSYSLDGGESWTKLPKGSNRASLVDLAPGTYTFMVKAINNNRESNTVRIKIHIASPWWSTGFAYTIYAIIISLIILSIVRTIRNRYKTKQRILQHKHREEINEAKLQFFINIYHEIRTPISLIINPLQKLINSDEDSGRQKKYRTIYHNSQRILILLNQLMDVRKIDKGLMVLSFKKTRISTFIENICEIFTQEYESKQIKLTLHDFDKVDEEVWVDPSYFDKIIINILSNAMKYTPSNGEIDIYISKGVDESAQAPLKNYFEIIIQDNGIGISKDEIGHIFERFYQIRNNINNANIGTGIGLNLTLSLIELHHGSINVESNTEGKSGTKFIIRLPLGNSHLKEEEINQGEDTIVIPTETISRNLLPHNYSDTDEKQKKRATTKFKILIADDDDDIRKYLAEELNSEYNIIECKDGKEALDLVFKAKPDLVLSDIMMPVMDGVTLCKKIKQNVTLNHIPVILLTAKTEDEHNLYALDNGADSYMTKPFNIEILKRTVFNLIRSRESLKAQIYDQKTKEKEMIKLKVDSPDDKLMQRIMKSINSNISNPNFTIEHLSKDVGISRVHLHRKLKELTNQTTRDFIRNIRLKQAALLLSEKHYTINEVATLVGFSNANNFSTSFKELYGVTPTEYMEKSLANKDKKDTNIDE